VLMFSTLPVLAELGPVSHCSSASSHCQGPCGAPPASPNWVQHQEGTHVVQKLVQHAAGSERLDACAAVFEHTLHFMQVRLPDCLTV
jgi:hypothetical protein